MATAKFIEVDDPPADPDTDQSRKQKENANGT
jgi:hypothetical protein